MPGNGAQLLLYTLGSVSVATSRGDGAVPISIQPKRLALLVYLALHPLQCCRRDGLVALFWPELDHDHARGALRQAVRELRRALGEEVILGRGEEELLVSGELLWCDAVALVSTETAGDHEGAVGLYRGDFLAGFFCPDVAPEFERWVDEERATLRGRAAVAAQALADAAEAAGGVEAATRWARRRMELAPDDERAVRRLIRLLDRQGNRAGALSVFQEFCDRLQADYGVAPAPETLALVTEVRARDQRVWESPLRGWPPGTP